MPFQMEGIQFSLARRSTLNADVMGLGKTVQAIGLINADTSIRRVLIVCPANLKLNWRRELNAWLTRQLSIGIVSSREWPAADISIVNYDILDRHDFAHLPWDLVILDECHYAKNPKAKRTKLALALLKLGRKRLALTGTPIVNRPREIWPVLNALDDKAWGNFMHFARRYCDAYQEEIYIPGGGGRKRLVWHFEGSSNLHELQATLRSTVMIRRSKEEVLDQLPPKRRQLIELPADSVEAKLAVGQEQVIQALNNKVEHLKARAQAAEKLGDKAAFEDAMAELDAAEETSFTEISRIRRETAVAKGPLVAGYAASLLESDEVGKLVIFAHHHEVVDTLVRELSTFGVVQFTGRETAEEKDQAVTSFQEGEARVFVGSLQAAGVGLTLTAAQTALMAELDWTPGVMAQAEDRLHRIGQTESVLIQYLVLDGSIDAKMANTIVDKADVIAVALDGGAQPAVPAFEGPPAVKQKLDGPILWSLSTAAELQQALNEILMSERPMNRLDRLIGRELVVAGISTPKQMDLGERILARYR